MKTTTSTATAKKAPLLNREQTEGFIKETDQALKELNAIKLKSVIEKYSLINYFETDEFLIQSVEILDFWKDISLDIKIDSVTNFDSKCTACSFGKKVNAYQVKYNRLSKRIFPARFICELNFAINFDIKENELYDFSWCNVFLSKSEIIELNAHS